MRKKSGMSISMPRIDSPLHHEILAREVGVSFGEGFVKFWDCGRFQIKQSGIERSRRQSYGITVRQIAIERKSLILPVTDKGGSR